MVTVAAGRGLPGAAPPSAASCLHPASIPHASARETVSPNGGGMCLVVAEGRCSVRAPTAADTLHFPSPSAPARSWVPVQLESPNLATVQCRAWAALGSPWPQGTHSRQGLLCGAPGCAALWVGSCSMLRTWPGPCPVPSVRRDPLRWDPRARAPQRLLWLQSRGWEQQPRREVVQEGGTREGTGGQC